MDNASILAKKMRQIIIYDNLTKVDPLFSLISLLEQSDADLSLKLQAYHRFIKALYKEGGDLGKYLSEAVRCDDNEYVRLKAKKKPAVSAMEDCFRNEMKVFEELSSLTGDCLFAMTGLPADSPGYETTSCRFTVEIPELIEQSGKYGYGIYARYTMFRVNDEGGIVPVLSPDPITFRDLIGYQAEQEKILNNVYALLAGKPAANMLLVGDAGTGKSSTVKAIVNQLGNEGLRLLELRKDQLRKLPEIIGEIGENPLKFIIFIDDLSFEPDDNEFGALKAVLEGSAAAKTPNVIICATSNRRHIIKETFTSRDGDEIHRNDTIEEQTSLSARFGLTVLFMKPAKNLYLEIAGNLAEDSAGQPGYEEIQVLLEYPAEFERQAEAFAIAKGGRSARVARQFIDSLLSRNSMKRNNELETTGEK